MKKVIVLFSGLVLILTACTEPNNVESEDSNHELKQVNDSHPVPKQEASNHEIAEHLAQLANRVTEVNEATAIIAGPYAIVAIDVDETLERDRVGTVKYSVSEALYKDPYGKTAVVIADADLIERFKQMGSKMKDGLPLQGIVDELAAIVGRYMPIMPTEDRAPDREQNKDEMTDEDESELNDIQKEQSDSDRYE